MNNSKIKLLALYLPQFHAIPENDRWWGEGFTEWTNVRKAEPLFNGHHQPLIPDDEVGYYDLSDPEVLKKQAKLAKENNIYGFCFYHYWFAGKRLLETPVNNLLKSDEPDMPFCLCWANENWTRRWDGMDNEVLIAQNHSDEDDIAFIKDIIPAFKDKRYIRIDNKPVLLVYRTDLFPDIKNTAKIWRKIVQEEGLDGIYLVNVQHFEEKDPKEIDFDAAMEFAPDRRNQGLLPTGVALKNSSDETVIPDTYPPHVYDYKFLLLSTLLKKKPDYKLFRSVFPCWDNTARRGNRATAFINSLPEYFEYFLKQIMKYTYKEFKGEERLLFVNAWNEWAEGCHLEPDKKHGKKYLEICKKLVDMPEKELINEAREPIKSLPEEYKICITKLKFPEQHIYFAKQIIKFILRYLNLKVF